MSRHETARQQSRRIALCGMITALGTALMMTGGLIPIMTYAGPMLCGLLLLVVIQECGMRDAWLVWLATVLLSLLLSADKESAFFYLVVGDYPLLKWPLEHRFPNRWVQRLVKLAYFTIMMVLLYSVLIFLLHMEAIMQDFQEMGRIMTILMGLVLLVCLFLYDRLLWPMSVLYVARIQPKLRKMIGTR